MQVSLENTAALERRMTVVLPAERLEGVVGSRLQEISRTIKLKGFRPGKVPAKVVQQRYGEQVRAEAFGELVRETFDEAIRQENLKPAGSPAFQPAPDAPAGEIRYTATFEVVPDFGDIDVTKLQFERVVSAVEDSDIDTMLGTLREQRRTWDAVERGADTGDMIRVETFATAEAGRFPPEGSEQGVTVLGSGSLLPELENQLVGLQTGDERELDITFPDPWRMPALAGQPAKISVKVLSVSAPNLPEIDEAFIKSFGIRSGKLEVFRKEVRANLERELKGTLMNRLRSEVMHKLVTAHSQFEMPPRLVEAEARNLANAAAEQAKEQGQDIKMLPENFMAPARNRVAASLLVGEIARQNSLRLDQARLKDTMQLIASTYEDPSQVIELYRTDPNLMRNLQNRVMEEQVIDWIAERANASEHPLSFSEAMRPPA